MHRTVCRYECFRWVVWITVSRSSHTFTKVTALIYLDIEMPKKLVGLENYWKKVEKIMVTSNFDKTDKLIVDKLAQLTVFTVFFLIKKFEFLSFFFNLPNSTVGCPRLKIWFIFQTINLFPYKETKYYLHAQFHDFLRILSFADTLIPSFN